MLHPIENLPAHVVGYIAKSIVTKTDYERTIEPALKQLQENYGAIHFIMIIETKVGNFSFGSWADDVKLALKYYTKWKKVAIVSDEKLLDKFADLVSVVMPGQVKGFTLSERENAINWVSEKV